MSQPIRLLLRNISKITKIDRFQRSMGVYRPRSEDLKNDVEIRRCLTHDELDKCVSLQKDIWKFNDLETTPRRTFLATNSAGGVVFGAFDLRSKPSPLLGFVWCFPGFCSKTKSGLYLHVELLGVHPNANGHQLAQKLMSEIRGYAFLHQIDLAMWNFDPLDSKLAHIYINRFGAIGVQYKSDYYGQASSSNQKHLPTDRIHVECWRESSHVQDRSKFMNELSSSGSDSVHEVHLPASINEWKRSGDPRAAEVLNDVRTIMTRAFEQNLVILDFQLKSDGSSVYKLGRYPSQDILTGGKMDSSQKQKS